MAALMKQRVIHVFTHDSIGLGEDGPTHQPVEHAASLRLIPNLDVWRPGDAAETAVAWLSAVTLRDGPSALLLSRQNLPQQPRTPEQALAIQRGGYVLSEREQARRDDHRHRQRGGAGGRRAEAARRAGPAGAHRVDAVHQPVRAPGAQLPRQRAAGRAARAWPSRRA